MALVQYEDFFGWLNDGVDAVPNIQMISSGGWLLRAALME